jgi:hypothetical protein
MCLGLLRACGGAVLLFCVLFICVFAASPFSVGDTPSFGNWSEGKGTGLCKERDLRSDFFDIATDFFSLPFGHM